MDGSGIGKAKLKQRVQNSERLNGLRRIDIDAFLFVGEIEAGADDRDFADRAGF